ncbi:voltage-gated potassium channel [Testicularia cyperi]|uniref:Voltage-gated potassium channel n=1 Tax=Testicularia cyperi TaxID=1882483 RepID=A0A317XFX0_9BASI|nr:voltage-gated potassium channel [Testicularia cyperi]
MPGPNPPQPPAVSPRESSLPSTEMRPRPLHASSLESSDARVARADGHPTLHEKEHSSKRKGLPNSTLRQSSRALTEVPTINVTETDSKEHDHMQESHDTGASSEPLRSLRVRRTPIFSGLVAPFSIVLEIPGLTSKWYADIDPDGIVIRFIDNPTILTVGLAISLGAAVVANLAIICRFLEILRPRVCLALAIAGFVLHDLINVVALGTFGGIYGPKDDGLSLSASYWMVCTSTITSALVTASLVMDYLRTKDFKHAGSGLTQLQKGLVLAGMGLLLYLSLGSLIFTFVIGIDFITALYFSTATILTVGFGDVVPPTAGGKVLVILYAPCGIILVALVVSAARNTILETFQESLMKRRREHRQRMAERRAAETSIKRQDRALRRLLTRTFSFTTSDNRDVPAGNETDQSEFATAIERMEQDAASSPPDKSSSNAASSSSAEFAAHGEPIREAPRLHPLGTTGDPALQLEIEALQHQLLTEQQRTEEEFRAFEEHAQKEAQYAARLKIVLAASLTAGFWLLGAVAFKFAERWSYGGALWFCFIAMITIGYGDYHPATQLGRAIFVIWGLLGVAVLTILLAVVQDAFGSVFHRALNQSTTRLFARAEQRARKRRLRRQHSEQQARSHAETDMEGQPNDEDEFKASREDRCRSPSSRHSLHRHHHRNRKSRDFARESEISRETEASKHRSLQEPSLIDEKRPDVVVDDLRLRSSSPIEMEMTEVQTSPSKKRVPSMYEIPAGSVGPLSSLHRATVHVLPTKTVPTRVEDTLVSQPQKVAHAALVAFQHSVKLLHLNEASISQAMVSVPALRQYYTSTRNRANSTASRASKTSQPSRRSRKASLALVSTNESRIDEAVQAGNASTNQDREREEQVQTELDIDSIYASVREAGNSELEQVARMVIANLEFEQHLRNMLTQIEGLKTQVEDFKIASAALHNVSVSQVSQRSSSSDRRLQRRSSF